MRLTSKKTPLQWLPTLLGLATISLFATHCGRLGNSPFSSDSATQAQQTSTSAGNEETVTMPVTMTLAEASQALGFHLAAGEQLIGADYDLSCSITKQQGRLLSGVGGLAGSLSMRSAGDSGCLFKILSIDVDVGESIPRTYVFKSNVQSGTETVGTRFYDAFADYAYVAGTYEIFSSKGLENDQYGAVYLSASNSTAPSEPFGASDKIQLVVSFEPQARDAQQVTIESTAVATVSAPASLGLLTVPFELQSLGQGSDANHLNISLRCDDWLSNSLNKCGNDGLGYPILSNAVSAAATNGGLDVCLVDPVALSWAASIPTAAELESACGAGAGTQATLALNSATGIGSVDYDKTSLAGISDLVLILAVTASDTQSRAFKWMPVHLSSP